MVVEDGTGDIHRGIANSYVHRRHGHYPPNGRDAQRSGDVREAHLNTVRVPNWKS